MTMVKTGGGKRKPATRDRGRNSAAAATLLQMIQTQATELESVVAELNDLRSEAQKQNERSLARVYDFALKYAVQNSADRADAVAYEKLLRRIRETVRRYVPINSAVIVISRGDEELLDLYNRSAMH